MDTLNGRILSEFLGSGHAGILPIMLELEREPRFLARQFQRQLWLRSRGRPFRACLPAALSSRPKTSTANSAQPRPPPKSLPAGDCSIRRLGLVLQFMELFHSQLSTTPAMADRSINSLNNQLVNCAAAGDLPGVASLLSQGADPQHEKSLALSMAARNGCHECAKLLIPVSNPADGFSALAMAASRGRLECVLLLLPFSDAKSDFSSALLLAVEAGYIECARALIPALSPNTDCSEALVFAAFYGLAEFVELLIPISDPKANDSRALRRAAIHGNDACVKLLLPVSAPLVEMLSFVGDVVDLGLASTFSIMIDHEPPLLSLLDLPALLGLAVANHHFELARLLSSLAERQSISEHLTPPTPPGGFTAPRL